MKRTFTSLVLGIALLVGGGGVGLAQDASTGQAAYARGDYATAYQEWSVLAGLGDAKAQFGLGFMYAQGQGVTRDYREALRWYRLSAAQGNAQAQVNLGSMYDYGQGVTQDYQEAVRWLRIPR